MAKQKDGVRHEKHVFGLEITLLTTILGTLPNDEQIFSQFIVSKGDNEEQQERARSQLATLPAVLAEQARKENADALSSEPEEPGLSPTVFHRTLGDNPRPILYSYVLRGFMKDTCGALSRMPGTLSAELRAYKKVIDGLVFAEPDELVLDTSEVDESSAPYQRFLLRTIPVKGQLMRYFTRPLRTTGASGERVALACSEAGPPGAKLRTNIILPDKSYLPLFQEWFDHGKFRGLGQWRNGGFGKFTYRILDPYEVNEGMIHA